MQEDLPQTHVSGLPSRRRGTAKHHSTVYPTARCYFDINDEATTPNAAIAMVCYGLAREPLPELQPKLPLISIQAGWGKQTPPLNVHYLYGTRVDEKVAFELVHLDIWLRVIKASNSTWRPSTPSS